MENDILTGEDLGLPVDFREHQHLHNLSTEKRHEALMSPFGVSFPEFRVLIYLMRRPEGAMPSQIADDLMILRQSMTGIVDSLNKRELVERQSHTRDRRKVVIRLLPKGLSLAKTLFQIEEDYTQRIYTHFTQEELQEYYRLKDKMIRVKNQELDKILALYKDGGL